jgi:hypothetical protein
VVEQRCLALRVEGVIRSMVHCLDLKIDLPPPLLPWWW